MTALLLAVYALWFAVASPIGEFPLDDDWAYAYSVRHLLDTGTLKLSNWTSATVVFQIYLASAVAWLSGGFSFTALRLTTLGVSLAGCVAGYDLFRQLRLERSAAALGTLAIAANPLFIYLSYTFMSDIFYFSLMLLSLGLYTRGIRSGRNAMLLAGSVAAALAYLSRQLGVVLPVAAALALLLKERRFRWRALLWIGLIPALVVTSHVIWLRFIHGVPWALKVFSFQASLDALLKPTAPLEWLHRLLLAMLYLGIFSLPVLVAGRLRPHRSRDELVRRGALFGVWLLVLGVCVGWLVVMNGRQLPYLANVINRQGLGMTPLQKVPITPDWVFWLVTAAAPFAGALQGALWTEALLTVARRRAASGVTLILASVLMALMVGTFVFLWDEYLLVFVPASLYLALRSRRISGPGWVAAVALITAMMGYGLVETGELFAWSTARWTAARRLVAQGVAPGQIDGGYEWLRWYMFEENLVLYVTGPKPPPPVQPYPYIVTFKPTAGYTIVEEVAYQTPLLGHDGLIYVLRRASP